MEGLQVRELTFAQAAEIYKKHLKTDFPPAEVKPLLVIRQAWRKKRYHAYGFYKGADQMRVEEAAGAEQSEEKPPLKEEEEVLCAYAFFLADHNNRVLLLDYFAVCRPLRGSGYGSCALGLLRRECAGWNAVVIEVEDDELPGLDEETRRTRQRRIAFYTAAGCFMTATRSRLWGVDYRIMVMPGLEDQVQESTVQGMAEKIRSLYEGMYEGRILKKHFEITAE